MTTEEGRKHSPPYVSYKTFGNFINTLQKQVPSRIVMVASGGKCSPAARVRHDGRNAVFKSD